MLIICFSARSKDSLTPVTNEHDISIDQITEEHPILDKEALIEEGRYHFRKLLEYIMSNHISSVNLIASISALSNIAKQRPEYMKIVIDSYSTLLSKFFYFNDTKTEFTRIWRYKTV